MNISREELIRQAAQGKVLFNDDTTMEALELSGEQRAAAADEETDERTGVFTSGVVSTRGGPPTSPRPREIEELALWKEYDITLGD